MFRSASHLAAGVFTLLAGISAYTQAFSGDLVPPKIVATSPGGVNLADGVYSFSQTDLSIGTLKLERFYIGGNPRDANTMFFGYHMTHNFDIYVAKNFTPAKPPLFPVRYKPIVHLGQGSSGTFVQSITTSVIDPSSSEASKGTLKLVSGAYVYTDQSGTVYTFSPSIPAAGAGTDSQRVVSIQYKNGKVLSFGYNSSGQLKIVLDNSDFALVFDYGAYGNVTTACGYALSQTSVNVHSTCAPAALKVSYGYTTGASPYLTSFTDVLNKTTTYGASLSCITPPGYSDCKIKNILGGPGYDMVSQQIMADGATWTYAYDGDYGQIHDTEGEASNGDKLTTLTDPNNKVSTYRFTRTTPYYFTDAYNRTTHYEFFGGADFEAVQTNPPSREGSILKQIQAPEGNQYQEIHGGYQVVSKRTWKAKPGSGLSDVVEDLHYGACPGSDPHPMCTQPDWVKDGRGNQTDYTYDSTHGAVLTTTLPADQNGYRQRTYNIYSAFNTGNGIIYRVTRTETCGLSSGQLSLTSCPALVSTAVTITDYGDATTAPYTYKSFEPYQVTKTDGAGSLAVTVINTYDVYGNLTIADGPRTDADDRTYKTYDLARRPVFEIGADPDGGGPLKRQIVRHNYDDVGREWKTEAGTGNATDGSDFVVTSFVRKTFDLMDRVITTETVQP